MDIEGTLGVLLQGNQLKRTSRTGWDQRGVVAPESVADHSYGVAFTVLILAPLLAVPVDMGKALTMALLHDLPESLTSDIPTPAWRLMPANTKSRTENQAMKMILDGAASRDELWAAWRELKDCRSTEARLVHDADKIELYLQAVIYQEQTGNLRLAEFWQNPAEFHFPQAEALYTALRQRRARDEDARTAS